MCLIRKLLLRIMCLLVINAVIYYRVSDAAKAILEVENFRFAVS